MHKLMCRFVITTKKIKKKIPNPNLDTACPAGIPCNYQVNISLVVNHIKYWLIIMVNHIMVNHIKY